MLIYFLQDFYDEIADQIFKLREQREKCTVNTAARDTQIARINELAKKSKTTGLTDAEKAEQQALRQEYVADVKASLRAQLDRTSIQEPDGTIHKVTRRADLENPRS